VTDALLRLRKDYGSAFLGYLTRRDEKGLRAAYEIGRRAMAKGISILDLVQIHHDVLLNALSSANSEAELQDSGRAAAAFLVEALASFEMTHRGFIEIGPGRDQPQEDRL
jgi:Phosphoserine phosphatase RsbU, N-terminal domain